MQSCREFRNVGLAAVVAAGLSACGGTAEIDGAPTRPPDISAVPDSVPKVEPQSRYGNPRSYKVFGRRYHILKSSDGYRERGIASWYGTKFHGRRTSSGEPYDMYAMSAAHKTLPLPTYARVTNLKNGRSVVLRINDRGPFHDNRLIDLSYTAAWKLGILATGTGYVEVEALDPHTPRTTVVARPVEVSAPGPLQVYLQAGSFSERANAERLRWRVEAIAANGVEVSPVMLNGRTTYRVRVGPIDTVTQADRLVRRFTELGMETPRIVIE